MLAAVGEYGFYNYYLQTGDVSIIDEVYNRVKRYLFDVWNPSNKELVDLRKGGWFWGDWGTNIDQEALQQCWYAIALKGFAKQARITRHNTDAMFAEQNYDKMVGAFNKRYWNKELQCYRTPEYRDEPDDRVQAMAVLAGFVPRERYEAMRNFFKKYYQSSTYMEKYVLEALCKMGYYEDALERMEKRFGEMVAAKYTTLWEGWEYTGGRGMTYKSGHGTYNHAWSGGGLIILSQYIAGIAPIEPEYRKFSVEPNLATLNFVESVVPTNFGNIEMRAEKRGGGLLINLTVPALTQAEVRLPHGYSELRVRNEVSNTTLLLSEGEHTIAIK